MDNLSTKRNTSVPPVESIVSLPATATVVLCQTPEGDTAFKRAALIDGGYDQLGSNLNTDFKLKRMNALKIKRSQTEDSDNNQRTDRDSFINTRRHSIQCVPFQNGSATDVRLNTVPSYRIGYDTNPLLPAICLSSNVATTTVQRSNGSRFPSMQSTDRLTDGSASLHRNNDVIEVRGSRAVLVPKNSSPSMSPRSAAMTGRKLKKMSLPSAIMSSSSSKLSTPTSSLFGRRSVGCITSGSGTASGSSSRSSTAFSASFDNRKKSFPDRSSLESIRASIDLRYQSSKSPEYFTLKFETNGAISDDNDTQVLPALKECNLSQMLIGPLEQRGLTVSEVSVFLESSHTALPLSSECFCLAGSVLHVRSREDTKKFTHQKSLSFSGSGTQLNSSKSNNGNLRTKRNGSTTGVASSGDDCTGGAIYPTETNMYGALSILSTDALKSRPPGLQRGTTARLHALFSPFAKSQDKQETLNEILSSYTSVGLTRNASTVSCPPTVGCSSTSMSSVGNNCVEHHQMLASLVDDDERRQYSLESSWTDVVVGHRSLDKRQRDHQEAVWELLTTELEYIHKLRVVIDLFMCCLTNLQTDQLLTEIDADKLFSNISDVYEVTCSFWVNHLSRVVEHSRQTGEMLNSSLLKTGFLMFDKIFEPYVRYCLEQETCGEYIKIKSTENELFRMFLTWCESQRQCGRLKLSDLLVKPWQRLTRYKLLLYAMRTPLDKMDSSDPLIEDQINAIDAAIAQVEKFVLAVNLALRQRQDHHQLSLATDRIESYDVIEPPNDECSQLVNDFCKLDLNCSVPGCGPQEIRTLLLEGCLRLKDTYAKADVYCFLFTDMFLVTKQVAKRSDKVKVVKPPMRLDKVIVHALRDPSSFMMMYLNEYNVAQSVYVFYGDTKIWLDCIAKAQSEYREKRTQHLARLDATVHFDLYAELDVDDDDRRSCSPTDHPLHRQTTLSSHGGRPCLRRSDSGSSSTSSNERPAAGSRSSVTGTDAIDLVTSRPSSILSRHVEDDGVSTLPSTIPTMTSIAETNGDHDVCWRPPVTSMERRRGRMKLMASDELGLDGGGLDHSTVRRSKDLKLSASAPVIHTTYTSRSSCSPPMSMKDASRPGDVRQEPVSPAAYFVVGDSLMTTSPLSSVVSLAAVDNQGDAAISTRTVRDVGEEDDEKTVVEDSCRNVKNGTGRRLRRAVAMTTAIDAENKHRRRSAGVVVGMTTMTATATATADATSRPPRTPVDNEQEDCSGGSKMTPAVHLQDQLQQQEQSRDSPVRQCRTDEPLVLNNTAMETSEV